MHLHFSWHHCPPVTQQNPVKGRVVSVGVASEVLGDTNLEVAQVGGGQGNVGSPGQEERFKVDQFNSNMSIGRSRQEKKSNYMKPATPKIK